MTTRDGMGVAIAAARRGLIEHRATAGVITAVLAIAAGATVAVAALAGAPGGAVSRLAVASTAPSPVFSAITRSPGATRQAAADALFRLLAGVSIAALGIGIVTVIALFATRAAVREGEIALARAVGASRKALMTAAVLEAGMIAALGLGLAAAIGLAGAGLAGREWPERLGGSGIGTGAAVAIAAAGLAAVLLGAALPLIFARTRRVVEPPARPVPLLIPGLQLAFSLAVLAAGALMARPQVVRGAVRAERGTVLRWSPERRSDAERAQDYQAAITAVHARGGPGSASLTAPGELVGLAPEDFVTTDCGACSEGGLPIRWRVKPASFRLVSPDSFGALGVKLVAGRTLDASDGWGATRVALVNRALAEREFQGGHALGRRLLVGADAGEWHTVVGIVDDPPAPGFGATLLPRYSVYLDVRQHPPAAVELLVPSTVSTSAAREILAASAPGSAISVADLTGIFAFERAPARWFSRWFSVGGWILLLLAAGGVASILGFWVESLRGELGLRRAVGARRRGLMGRVAVRAAATGLAGIVGGAVLGPALWAGVAPVLPGSPAWDWSVIASYGVVLVGVAIAGALWRAIRILGRPPARTAGG